MAKRTRIRLSQNQRAYLIDEAEGMCPLCSEVLLTSKSGRKEYLTYLAEAAHIYPHSLYPGAAHEVSENAAVLALACANAVAAWVFQNRHIFILAQ